VDARRGSGNIETVTRRQKRNLGTEHARGREAGRDEVEVSEFQIEVVRIGKVSKLENSDTLAITTVHDGYPCIVKLGDFTEGDLAVYIPVDALCPVARPEFKFLDAGKGREFERIKARRLRGTFSMGLLIRAPVGAKVGDNLQAYFGIEKWEPPAEREPQQRKANKHGSWIGYLWLRAKQLLGIVPPKPPSVPVYDIEGIRKYANLIPTGEQVVITEKIHGCNARYIHTGKRFYVGSRTQFRGNGPSVWHDAAKRYDLERIMHQYPGAVLFGEVYGSVQDLKYGVPASEGTRFVVFDVLWESRSDGTRKYMDWDQLQRFCGTHRLPVVPELYRGPWSPELTKLAEGNSTMEGAKHVREGFVVRPLQERVDPRFGRVQLKLHGEGYLTRKGSW
jgi:tRNA-binding EMAP/Myf-like protein